MAAAIVPTEHRCKQIFLNQYTAVPEAELEAELDDTRTNEEFSSSEAESDFTDDDSDSDFDYLTETTESTDAS